MATQDNRPRLQETPSRTPTPNTSCSKKNNQNKNTTVKPTTKTIVKTTRSRSTTTQTTSTSKPTSPNNPPPGITMVLHDTKSYLFLIGFLILICLPMAALCGKRDKVIADKELEVERAGQHLPLEEWYKPQYSPYTRGARPFRHIEAYARTGETNIGDAPEDRRELRDRMSMEG